MNPFTHFYLNCFREITMGMQDVPNNNNNNNARCAIITENEFENDCHFHRKWFKMHTIQFYTPLNFLINTAHVNVGMESQVNLINK